jgi:hypothetical protein
LTDRIPQEILDREMRRLCRGIASMIVGAMAETDTGFDILASRTGRSEKLLRRWFERLIDGQATETGLRIISNMATAMDCRLRVSLHKLPLPPDFAEQPATLNMD